MTDIPDIEKALDRFHETAEQLAEIEHFEGRVPGCDYEPIFKGSVDLLDARSLIAALRDERDAAIADRAAQAERMARMQEAVSFVARWAWRTDPPNATGHLTDTDRLSCIKHHPTIKNAAQPHIELAEAEAARALSQEGSDARAWPSGCLKPSSCERHKACMYVGCPNQDRDIANEVDAAVARAKEQETR